MSTESASWTTTATAAEPTITPTTTISSTMATIVETLKTLISEATTTTTTTMSTTSKVAPLLDETATPTTTEIPVVKQNVADLSSSLQHFGIVDYLVFVLMLLVCAVIGFYFGFIEKRQKKNKTGSSAEKRRGSEALDYLVGGRKMKVFPVSLSLVASFVSGISLLGTSTEIYVYGTQYAFILITLAISGVISWYIFLPVFCNLQLTSTYEYFELRFNKSIRLFGSVLFTLGTIVWLPIVIYVPALAFNQVTGINIHIITPVVCLVCIFYTCVGGLKAVVWTDVIQTVVMIGAIILVIIKGTIDVGGLGVVWQRNFDSGRIVAPTMTMDPTERISMFSIFAGSTLFYVQCISGNQVIVQRYLSLPGLKQVKSALILFILGIILLTAFCMYNGLLIYATYYDCDPLSTKLAKAKDQLVPLLVMDILSIFPGIPGLFVAGVFSAALSSLSTGLNSLAAVFLEDYIKPLRKTPLSERQTAIIMRLSVVLVGILCVGLVFVVEIMGTHVMQLSMTLGSITIGPLFGLFLCGLLIPIINSKSAITGSSISFILMTWICIEAQLALGSGELVYPEKPVTTAGCSYSYDELETLANSTISNIVQEGGKTFAQHIYHMSFMFYATVGAFLTVIFAYLATFIYGRNDISEMDLALFAPCVRRFIKPSEYASVESDEQTVIMGFESMKSGLKS